MKQTWSFPFILVILFFHGLLSVSAESGGHISFTIQGCRSKNGTLYVMLQDSPQGFPGSMDRVVAGAQVPARVGEVTLVLAGVRPGRYAISYFHDENNNQHLDSNVFGIPQEGYGFSNNARGFMGPPSFVDAAFNYDGGILELRAKIEY